MPLLYRNILEQYNNIYDLDLADGSTYSKLDSEEKRLLLYELLIKYQPYDEVIDIQSTFEEQNLIVLINTAPWTHIEIIFKEYKDVLNLDFNGDYLKLDPEKDLPKLYKNFALLNFNSIGDIQLTFEKKKKIYWKAKGKEYESQKQVLLGLLQVQLQN